MPAPLLEHRFERNLRRLGLGSDPGPVVVALSGGLDSTVLLHLLGQIPERPFALIAAHFDHRMRPDSAADVAWVQALCERWKVPIRVGTATTPLTSEAGARDARYRFLRDTASETGAAWIATAHQADDQAETVLFRIARGTGLRGLGGIPEKTQSGLIRPLLPFWRSELREYAERQGLDWLTDPTNATLLPVRNRIRHSILPALEREVSPAARRHLVELARLARESERGWLTIVRQAARDVVHREGEALVLARDRLRRYDRALRIRLVRWALHRFGLPLTRAGTRTAHAFITDAPSGRELQLPGGVRIRTEFERAIIERCAPPPEEDTALSIPAVPPGTSFLATLQLAGMTYRVEARQVEPSATESNGSVIWRGRFPTSSLHFPLLLRGRRPGDRIRSRGLTKSLKKLMIERRVPLRERPRRPVLVNGDGSIIWVAGLEQALLPAGSDETVLELTIRDG